MSFITRDSNHGIMTNLTGERIQEHRSMTPESSETLRTRLAPEEVKALHEAGYFLCGKVLTNDELAEARVQVDRAVSEYTKDGMRPEKINFVHTYDDYFLQLVSHPRLLDLVESVIGPDIAVFSSHLLCKPGGDGQPVAWHQDGAYWPLEPMEVLTLWLALDGSDSENGCMRVVPGSHKGGEMPHRFLKKGARNVLRKEVDPEFGEQDAVDIVLRAGECSLHLPWIVHGSNANTSPRRRAGFPIRYIPTRTRVGESVGEKYNPNYPDLDYAKILTLLRGEDRAGNTYVNG